MLMDPIEEIQPDHRPLTKVSYINKQYINEVNHEDNRRD